MHQPNSRPTKWRRSEVDLGEILQILNRRRRVLIASIAITLGAAGLFSILSPDVYEASALIKKVESRNDRSTDEVSDIVRMQTSDAVETEMEVLKSRTVLDKVVEALQLCVTIDGVTDSTGTKVNIWSRFFGRDRGRPRIAPQPGSRPNSTPRLHVLAFHFPPGYKETRYYLVASAVRRGYRLLELYDADTDRFLMKVPNTPEAKIEIPAITFTVDWPSAPPGSRLYFHVDDWDTTIRELGKSIRVQSILKTNVIKISVRDTSPYRAQRIANTLTEKFRESRLEQQQQTIRSSLTFLDSRLQEVAGSLERAEAELNDFRRRHQITTLDQTVEEAVKSLSTLKAEKINTDLELAEYRSRYEHLNEELQRHAFFDQTFLTPNVSDTRDSPFSTLMRELSAAELERLELLQKRTPNHPDVKAVEERIAEIRGKLTQYNQNTLTAYNVIMASLSEKQADLQRLIDQYSSRLQNLTAGETRLMELTRNKGVYEQLYLLLLDKREEMRIAELTRLQDVEIVDQAFLPSEPVFPRKRLNVIIGLALGSLIGLVLVFWREFQGKTVDSLPDVTDGFGLNVLSIFPRLGKTQRRKVKEPFTSYKHIDLLMDAQAGFKESYRVLRTKLLNMHSRGEIKNVVAFTSCEAGTGKTTIVSNLALTMALSGQKILLIDCDLKKPNIDAFFQLPKSLPGLIDYLTGGEVGEIIYKSIYHPTDRKGQEANQGLDWLDALELSIIPAGGHVEHSSELLTSDKFASLLHRVSQSYDFVLLDTPPGTKVVDSLVLGQVIKDFVLIIQPHLTRKDSLARALQEFQEFDIHLAGVVMNQFDMKSISDYYGYGYGYYYRGPGPYAAAPH